MAEPYVRYTVVDPQSLEPCARGTGRPMPRRCANGTNSSERMANSSVCGIAGIDAQGDVHLLADTPSPPVHTRQPWTSREGALPSGRRRPGWIWVISIFYMLSGGWTLLSFYLIFSGSIPLMTAQRAYFEALSSVDMLLTFLIGLVNLSGAIALFLLRRVAFHLFVGALVASTILTVWHAATKGWIQALGGAGFLGVIIGYGMIVAVCVYSWKLMKQGTLV